MGLDNVPRCQHVKMNGTQCGSPALRRRRHCFFHERIRREQAKIAADTSVQRGFDLPLLEDANSVQMALMKVIQMLGSGRMDHKTAGLMLYALQTASINLRNATFEVSHATDVVIDRDDVHRTCIKGPQWFEEDFEGEAGENEEDNEEDDQEDNAEAVEQDDEEAEDNEDNLEHRNVVVAGQLDTAAAKKQVAAVKHLTADEAGRDERELKAES
jgi:hypothetical protein